MPLLTQALRRSGRSVVIAVPWLWLLLFFVIPFVIVLKISVAETRWLGTPPYSPLFEMVDGRAELKVHTANFVF